MVLVGSLLVSSTPRRCVISLTFTLPAPELDPSVLLEAAPDVLCVGPPLTPGDTLPATPRRLGRLQATSRPIEVWVDDGLLHVRLPTNGACIETSRFGVDVLCAAADASGAAITDEEGQAFADAASLREHYSEDWCRQHARFGLETMAHQVSTTGMWAIMPTFTGSLTVRPERVQASRDAHALFAILVRRAWIDHEAPGFPMGRATIGAALGDPHDVDVLDVQLGRRGHVDNTVGWARVEGIDGLVPVAELVDAYGDDAELIDDGCVVLGALGEVEVATVREAVRVHAVADVTVLKPFPRVPRSDTEALLHDLQLFRPAVCLVHPDHAREVLAQRHADAVRIEELKEASALPLPVRRLLALAPLRAALLVAAADGSIDMREKMAILGAARSQPEGPLKDLWRTAFDDDDESWAEALSTDPVAPLVQAVELGGAHLAVAARTIWCDGVLARAQATAEASGGRFGFFGQRVGAEEQAVLDGLRRTLDQARRMP